MLLIAAPGPAQEPKPRVPDDGCQAFLLLLQIHRAEPIQRIEDLAVDPKETLLVVFGSTVVLDDIAQVTGGLDKFQRDGGSILIASDWPDEGRLVSLQVEISGKQVVQDRNVAYRGNADCPQVARHSEHPLFAELRMIATNKPSSVSKVRPCSLEVLAPFVTSLLGGHSGNFAVCSSADAGPEGRVLIIGGHGVFLNRMMGEDDNNNFLFAFNCVHWLSGADHGRHKRVLFVEKGRVHRSFDVPLTEIPPLPVPPTRVLNDMLRGLEQENAFNQLLLEAVGRERILAIVLVVLSVMLLGWGLWRLVLGRHRRELALPLVERSVARTLGAPAVLTQRRREMLRQGNLWEAARTLARHCFEANGAPGVGWSQPPALVVKSGWWPGWKLRRQVGWLWDLAYGPDPVAVSARRLGHVRTAAWQVAAALRSGALAFVRPQEQGTAPNGRAEAVVR